MEPWDDRGQSIQIGAVLIFAALILLLSLYQATIVPQQNEQIEFDHSQQVQGDLLDLRNAVTSMLGESASRSVSIQLGTTYPSRVLAVNPPPASGLLRTAGTADGDVNFTLSNVEALDEEADDFWDTGGSSRAYGTGSVVYRPSYNEYGQPPRTVYDATVLYDNFTFEGSTIARSDQTLVDGSTISLVALNGSLQQSSSGAASVDVRPVSASSTTVTVTNRTDGDPITLRTATRLPEQRWVELLADQRASEGGNVSDAADAVRTEPLDVPGYRRLIVELVPGTYELRMAKAGVGTRVGDTSAAYMTDVAADGSTVPEDGSVRLTVEVRDAYNNPVPGINVTGQTSVGGLAETEVATGDDGRASFVYEAPGTVTMEKDVQIEFNFTRDPTTPAPFNARDPEDVEVVVSVQNTQVPGGSGGGGAGYSLTWTDAATVPGTTGGASCPSAPDPCNVTMRAETSEPQIGAPIGFGSNDTSIARVFGRVTATGSDGTAETTARFERAEGNATLWTQSAGVNATRNVSTPSYASFDTDFEKWGAFGTFQGSGPFRTSSEGSNGGQAVVLPGGTDGGIVTTGYDTTGAELVVFQYWIKESDVGETSDDNGDMVVEYRDSGGNWVQVDSLALTGTAPGQQRVVRMGAGAIHDDLAVRFRQIGADTANDEWVIDDPQISVVGKAVGGGSPGGTLNQPPSASFTVSPSNPSTGEQVTFDAAGSTDSDGSVTSYSWDFDDGTTDSGSTATHTYGSSGTYTVTLTVTDDDGATDTETQQVTVSAPGGFARTSATALLPDTDQQRQTFTFTPNTEIPSGTQVELTLNDPQQQSPLQVDYQGGANANVSLSNSNSDTNGDTAFITITPSSTVAAGETVRVWTDAVTTDGDGQYDVTVTRGDTGVTTTTSFEVGRNVGGAEIRNFEATDLQADTSSQQQTFTFTLDSDLAGGERVNVGLSPAEGGSDVSYQGLNSVNVSTANTNFNKNAGRVWVLIEAPSGGLSAGTGVEVVVNANTDQLAGAPYEIGITRGDAGTTSTTFGTGQSVQFSNFQGFAADPTANEFTLDQVQVQDGDNDDDLDRIEYVVTDGDGNTVATRTVTGIGPAQYQPSGTPAVTIAADSPVVGGETYTVTATAYDADGNSLSQSRTDTTPTPTATTVTPTAFNDRDNDNNNANGDLGAPESEVIPPEPDDSGNLENFGNLGSEDGATATIQDGGQTTNVGLELHGITPTADDYRIEIGYTNQGYNGAGTMDVVLVDAAGTELQRESLLNTGEPEELAFTVNNAAESAIADAGAVYLLVEKTGGGYASVEIDYVRATALTDGNARDGGPPSATVTSVTTGNCNNGNGNGYCVSWSGTDPDGDFTNVTTILEDASGTALSTEITTFGPTGSNTGDQRHNGFSGSPAQVRVIARDANGNELVFTRPIP
mgnify:CR=1 FL=1